MRRTIAIVGAGRVGRTLGRSLRELGWRIGAVVTRSRRTARAAVRAIGAGHAHAGLTPRVLAADVVLISTPDRAIAEVAAELARHSSVAAGLARQGSGVKPPLREKVVLHTSGVLTHDVLAPLARRGASSGSLHPMQTFSGQAPTRLEGVVFAIDGDARARRVARGIARSLGGLPVVVGGGRRVAYHAAGGFAAQHLLSVVEAGTRILMGVGFTRRQASRAMLRLGRQTLDNFERLGPRAAWTGPLARGDFGTLSRHVAALRRHPREIGDVYAALTRLALKMLGPGNRATPRRLARILRRN